MVPEHILSHGLGHRGFTAVELMVVMAIIGVIGIASVPSLMAYRRAATTKAAAQELVAGLNTARQLALAKGQSVCVEVASGTYRFRVGGCGSATWTGPGTAADGSFKLTNKIALTTNANPVFTYLGAAVPGATLTVTNPENGQTLHVVVAASGRIQITP